MVYVNGSFIQTDKHATKSDKFVPVSADRDIAKVLTEYGFNLVSLKSGRAKTPDRADFQTTIARYRAIDDFGVDGCNFDILVKVPHLYGAIEFRLGFFRGICANQWNAGKLIESAKVRHVGDALGQVDALIPHLVGQRDALVDQIKCMQARNVSPYELAELAKKVATLRLAGSENVTQIDSADLLTVRRAEDAKSDLFSVINVLQENATRHAMRYTVQSVDENGQIRIRNMTTRPTLKRDQNGNEIETVKSVDLTGSIWNAAAELIKNPAA